MGRFVKELIEHLLEVLWALILIYLFLACLAVIFGRSMGYEVTSLVCIGFALVVTAIFASLVLGNLLWIALAGIWRRWSHRRKQPL